ncbi:MAG: hypothetical protein U0235_32840 [Polyangiaceae bacterium]
MRATATLATGGGSGGAMEADGAGTADGTGTATTVVALVAADALGTSPSPSAGKQAAREVIRAGADHSEQHDADETERDEQPSARLLRGRRSDVDVAVGAGRGGPAHGEAGGGP